MNAVSFAVSAAVLTGLREPGRTVPVSVSSRFTHVRDGLRALAALPLLKALAVGQFLAALSAGATSALLVVLAQDRLGGGGGYGASSARSSALPSGRCWSSGASPTRDGRCSCSVRTPSGGWSTWSCPW